MSMMPVCENDSHPLILRYSAREALSLSGVLDGKPPQPPIRFGVFMSGSNKEFRRLARSTMTTRSRHHPSSGPHQMTRWCTPCCSTASPYYSIPRTQSCMIEVRALCIFALPTDPPVADSTLGDYQVMLYRQVGSGRS